MKRIYVGIDVSKDDFKVGVKDSENNQLAPVRTYRHDRPSIDCFYSDITALKEQMKAGAVFGMEATGIYHLPLYQYLLDAEADVKVFNAIELKRFKGRIRKTKTDALDALAIADALLLAAEPSYHPTAEPELTHLRELCRLRHRLVEKRSICKTQATRNVDALCPSSIAVLKAAFRTTKLFETEAATLADVLAPYMPRPAAEAKSKKLETLFRTAVTPEYMVDTGVMELHMLVAQYELLEEQIKRVERRIEKAVVDMNPRICTIPGLGILTVGIILGELGDLKRFKSVSQLTAFAGLDPSVSESGRSKRMGHISKRGSPMLRESLYNAGLAASRNNPVCKRLYERLRAKGKHHKVCMVAVARKLLHIAYAVETKQRDFYVPSYMAVAEEAKSS